MCIGSNSVNQAQDLISVTKFEDFPNSLLPNIQYRCTQYCTGVDLLRGRDRGGQGAPGRRHLHPLAGLPRWEKC